MIDNLSASALGGSFLVVLAHTLLTPVFRKAADIVFPYDQITINQYRGQNMQRNELYTAAEAYLSKACSSRASNLKAELGKEHDRPVVMIDDNEDVTDTFKGTKVWWYARKRARTSTTINWREPQDDDIKYYQLSFNKRKRKLVEDEYLEYIIKQGDAATVSNRKRRLFTNDPINKYSCRGPTWSHVAFKHPSTFDTLAMDPERKKVIKDDLVMFRDRKEYYKKIGKAWKRGYLLYGPPGSGKSSMIAAIANFMEYDVYDLELTAVKTNTNLRQIFTEITSKAVIVIEDIDCSVDLTNKRKEKKTEKDDEEKIKLPGQEDKDESSKLTLSGLLNFIDGLWSACGGERIIIFTTNHLDKLDPALIRRGRMDMHIEMSYCTFEAFKVLAKNYLRVEQHELFGTIRTLLSEVNITPADVAEELMPKRSIEDDVGETLKNLIKVIGNKKKADEDAAKEKEKLKAESSDQRALVFKD